jgi:hypothetical protein
MVRHIPKQASKEPELSKFSFLPYVASHWLWHTLDFDIDGDVLYDRMGNIADRRHRLFRELVLWKKLPFDFRPWEDFNGSDSDASCIALLGWALMTNHSYLIRMASIDDYPVNCRVIVGRAWELLNCTHLPDTLMEPNNVSEIRILKAGLDLLDAFPEDSYVLQAPMLPWLYSRLVYACRRGYRDVLSWCQLQHDSASRYIVEHLIIEAARSGQLSVVEYFSSNYEAIVYREKVATVRTWSFPGRYLSAIEHASLAGHYDIVSLLEQRGYGADDADIPTVSAPSTSQPGTSNEAIARWIAQDSPIITRVATWGTHRRRRSEDSLEDVDTTEGRGRRIVEKNTSRKENWQSGLIRLFTPRTRSALKSP